MPIKQEVVVKIEPDPRQITARVAAIAIRQPKSAASTSSEEAHRPSYRTQPLCRIPSGQLGPADQPRGCGRPKGSKSRPRVAFAVDTLPERQEKLRAEERLSKMSSRLSGLGAPAPIPPRSTACESLRKPNTPRPFSGPPFTIFLSFILSLFRPISL